MRGGELRHFTGRFSASLSPANSLHVGGSRECDAFLLVSARTGTDFLTKARLPPLQEVALEEHDSPKSRRTKEGSGNVCAWSVAAVHH